MKKRFLILSNVALAGLLTVMGCSKKVVSDPIEQPEPNKNVNEDLPPLLYGPPPVRYDDQNPQDTTKNKRRPNPRIIDDERNRVKPLYGVQPAEFQVIEEKK
jgi:hypothetical protein